MPGRALVCFCTLCSRSALPALDPEGGLSFIHSRLNSRADDECERKGVAMMELGPDNAIWDGEWVSWDEINEQIQYKEWRARYPNADLSVVGVFESLIGTAQEYHALTGRHLQVYGDIGELYGVITYGLKLHRNYAQGSDGRIGNHFVEVKTITPFKSNDRVTLNLTRNFSQVLVVKINEDFEVKGKLIDRKALPKIKGHVLRLDWEDFKQAS